MVEIRAVQKMLIVVVLAIFVAGVILVLLSGAGVLVAAAWSFLNIIGGTFPLNPALVDEGNLLVLFSQVAGVLGNVVFTILVTTIFYQALGRVNIRGAYAKSKLRMLNKHIVLTPINSLSMELARRLKEKGIQFVMVDASARNMARAMSEKMLSVEGEAIDQEALRRARVENAYILITLSENDISNMLTAITAKNLNGRLRIV